MEDPSCSVVSETHGSHRGGFVYLLNGLRLQSPLNLFFQRYYYLVKAAGAFSRRAKTGVGSEAIFRSIEEQATQSAWWDCE